MLEHFRCWRKVSSDTGMSLLSRPEKADGRRYGSPPAPIGCAYCLTHTVVIGSFVLAGVPTSVNFLPSAERVIVLW